MDGLNTTPPADGMPVVGRPILDANIGLTNRIEHDDICEIMINTFNDIAEVLSDHCGPYGQFAMITTPNNKVAEPVFTKDGIGIVRAMEYMSPMEEFVRTTLAYIGSRIETAAGDGTTSSMIICATGLSSLMSWLQSAPYAYTYTKMIDVYNTFVASICKLLNENKYTVDKLQEKYSFPRKELIRRIAYNQAFTS
jgi:chaperonin GroEL (HSP60 family)